ncbi:hypothetical protein POM88_031144 [Heracleum sosnowskyi]|uniref:Uncharacterized protein n=1 Tax=Heracleum sosnowskyi TaxID=360622 RepID=A0AAD8HY96_9APIA|nr:hypothetical protein POM88_031144 [Heracleum sosnowskyi]
MEDDKDIENADKGKGKEDSKVTSRILAPEPQKKKEQGARAARSGRGARRQGAQSGLGDQQYRRLMRRIDAMHDINRSFVQEMTVSLDRVFARDGVQIDWPIYGAHQQYPPPDSPPGSPPEEGGPHAQ